MRIEVDFQKFTVKKCPFLKSPLEVINSKVHILFLVSIIINDINLANGVIY